MQDLREEAHDRGEVDREDQEADRRQVREGEVNPEAHAEVDDVLVSRVVVDLGQVARPDVLHDRPGLVEHGCAEEHGEADDAHAFAVLHAALRVQNVVLPRIGEVEHEGHVGPEDAHASQEQLLEHHVRGGESDRVDEPLGLGLGLGLGGDQGAHGFASLSDDECVFCCLSSTCGNAKVQAVNSFSE